MPLLDIVLIARIRMTADNYWLFLVVALVAVFGSVFSIAFSVWFLRHRRQVRLARMITDSLGLSLITKGRGRNQTDWYGGNHKDFSFALQTRTVSYRGTGNIGTANRRVSVYVVRICVPISLPSEASVNIFRSIAYGNSRGDSFDSFEDVFCYREGAERIADSTKLLVLDFARRWSGGLLIKTRQTISKYHLPESLSENSTLVMIHDADLREVNKESLPKRLDELIAVANEIQSGGSGSS